MHAESQCCSDRHRQPTARFRSASRSAAPSYARLARLPDAQTPSARRSIQLIDDDAALFAAPRRGAAEPKDAGPPRVQGPGFLGLFRTWRLEGLDALDFIKDDNDNRVDVTSIGAGWAHSAAVLEDGVCVVWGRYLEPPESALRLSHIERVVPPLARLVNATASLLDRDNSLRLRPTPITDDTAQVACGAGVTALIKSNGSLETMGANQFGQCGVGDHSDVVREPAPVKWDSPTAHLHRCTRIPPRPLSLRGRPSPELGQERRGSARRSYKELAAGRGTVYNWTRPAFRSVPA